MTTVYVVIDYDQFEGHVFSQKQDAEDYVRFFEHYSVVDAELDNDLDLVQFGREMEWLRLKKYSLSLPIDGTRLPPDYSEIKESSPYRGEGHDLRRYRYGDHGEIETLDIFLFAKNEQEARERGQEILSDWRRKNNR